MNRLICFIAVCITSLPYVSRPRRSHLGRHAAHLIVSAAQAHCPRLFADISDERARLQARQMDQYVPQDRLKPTAAVDFGALARNHLDQIGRKRGVIAGRKREDYHRAQRL